MLALCLTVFFFQTGQAAHESGSIGPYAVSFDMNTTMDYQVIVESASNGVTSTGVSFTRYNMTIDSTDYFAWLILTRYETPMVANVTANEYIVYNALLSAGADEPKIYTNISIDGKPAVFGDFRFDRQYLGSGQYQEGDLVVAAVFSPDAKLYEDGSYMGTTDCRVISTYPWEVITYLLYTLHIEVPEEALDEASLPVSEASQANASENSTMAAGASQNISM